MVTRDTRWPAGTPCWVDISVDDVPKAIAFYQALFGWDIQAGGPEVGGYAIAHLNDRIVAGIGPKFGPPDAPSAWTTYLASDDADATAEKIKAAGGQVAQGPMDVMEEGRMAVALDTTGAAFRPVAGRQDHRHRGGQRDRLAGLERAPQLGLRRGQGLLPRGVRLCVPGRQRGRLPVRDAHGRWPRGRRHRPVHARDACETPAAWSSYFAVDSTDVAVAAAVELGGSVVQPIRDSPYGRIGVVTDNQGAVFSLITGPQPQ